MEDAENETELDFTANDSCNSLIDMEHYLHYSLAPSVIIILVLSCLEQRLRRWSFDGRLNKFYGHCGVVMSSLGLQTGWKRATLKPERNVVVAGKSAQMVVAEFSSFLGKRGTALECSVAVHACCLGDNSVREFCKRLEPVMLGFRGSIVWTAFVAFGLV